jgi:amidase
VTIELPPARHKDIRQFRMAVWADSDSYPLDEACRAAIEAYVDDLQRLGAKVDRKARPSPDPVQSFDTYIATLFGILGASVPDETRNSLANAGHGAHPGTYEARISQAVTQSLRHWMGLAEERERLYRRWREFFTSYDVLLCPITPTVAFPHDTSGTGIAPQFSRRITVNGEARPYMDNLAWPGLATVANLPATAVPTRRLVDGLPVGLQVVGPYLEDRTPLQFARLASQQLGGFVPPPIH